MHPLLTLAEVAAILRKSPDRLARVRLQLERETGFPAPVLGGEGGGLLLWSPSAIEAWIERRSRPRGRAGRPPASGPAAAQERAIALLEKERNQVHAGVAERQTPGQLNANGVQVIPFARS